MAKILGVVGCGNMMILLRMSALCLHVQIVEGSASWRAAGRSICLLGEKGPAFQCDVSCFGALWLQMLQWMFGLLPPCLLAEMSVAISHLIEPWTVCSCGNKEKRKKGIWDIYRGRTGHVLVRAIAHSAVFFCHEELSIARYSAQSNWYDLADRLESTR